MRNSLEITRKYQFAYMLIRHFAAVMICFLFEAAAFYGFLSKPTARLIVSVVFTVVYGGVVYSAASKLAVFDRKPYTPLKPNIKWSVLWGLMISMVIAVMILLFKLNWALNNNEASNGIFVVINIIFYISAAPFLGFIRSGGMIPVWAVCIMLILPIVACVGGYYTGEKNIDIMGRLDKLTFENEDD